MRQINLDDLLQYASKKVKKEVLDEAPEELQPPTDVVSAALEAVYLKWGWKPPRRR